MMHLIIGFLGLGSLAWLAASTFAAMLATVTPPPGEAVPEVPWGKWFFQAVVLCVLFVAVTILAFGYPSR